MRRKKIPSAVAIIIVILVILIIANISSIFILTSVNSFTTQIPKYTEKSTIIINSFWNNLNTWGFFNEHIKNSLDISKIINAETIANLATNFFTGIAGLFANFVLIMIYVIFLLTEFGSIRKRLLKAFSTEKSRVIADTATDIFTDIKKYILGKTLINLLHGLIITFILWIFGVDFFIVWGFLAFLMAYIPNIGTMISTILPFSTSLIQFDGDLTKPLIILILMVVAGNVIGNIVEPKVLGDKLNISPIVLLVSLIFWGYLWGIVGMILSVPIMSMIKIILGKFEQTRSIAILMSYDTSEFKTKDSGRPAEMS